MAGSCCYAGGEERLLGEMLIFRIGLLLNCCVGVFSVFVIKTSTIARLYFVKIGFSLYEGQASHHSF